ncbi:zonular occludens toxin domain-containing protein [Pseudomonas sp. Gutcm_11s]|uniref:zonular occludens toxin domain-containing protein n=1 Tax=Pseudomonas sp. Gutcm_11s TaxID=3026088 RepID=UPI00235E5459|nr:zonular occludens toxin domain-containing protein [Pseudomonas sp. Gutcm_11s]MDD0841495.1 zonular occludens toxin domain-containing protein [Pseudomonas sp. Gutcm_11s]
MLYIRTGLQGHGKTLNTIKEVDTKAKAEGRTVYFHNVTDLDPSRLQAEWYPFEDPLKWFELPDNALIVVDEAQGWFGVRDPRKEVPEHISRFEIMRKQGHEVHLITQDPRFIDVHARRLCNKHIHYWRIFGSSKVSRYEIERVYNDVEKINGCKDASRTIIGLDKRYFGVYSSAKAEHHFKFKPSKKLVFLLLAAGIGLFCAWRAYALIWGQESPDAPSDAPAKEQAGNPVTDIAKSLIPGVTPAENKTLTPAQYIARHVPRVPNLPASAPVYDDLTKPQSFPRLYCLSSTDPDTYARNFARMPHAIVNGRETVCQCYTQQATRVQTDFAFCMQTVEYGYFDPAIPDRSKNAFGQQQMAQRQNPTPTNTSPQQPATQPKVSTTVADYEKGRSQW